MELKDSLPIKYHLGLAPLVKGYPSDEDIAFDIFSFVLAYNKRKKRKKLKGEFSLDNFKKYYESASPENQEKIFAVLKRLKDNGDVTVDGEIATVSVGFINTFM